MENYWLWYNFSMPDMKIKDYGRSKVVSSEYFDIIMSKYELFGKHLSIRQFYRDYVAMIDPKVSYSMWQRFMQKHNKQIKIKAEAIMKRVTDKDVQVVQMEEDSAKKILAIADLTLDEIIKNPDLLNAVPIGQRLNWLFQAMKARDSRMNIKIKGQSEVRKQTVFDELLEGAQYGGLQPDEIIRGKIEQKQPKVIEVSPEPVEEKKEPEEKPKVVAFDPKEMDKDAPSPAPPKEIPEDPPKS